MATHVWTGATNTSYNNAGNWTGGIPAAGGDVTFSGSVNCVMDVATAALNSWDMTGYTGILSSTGNIRIDNTADAAVLFAGGTHTWSGQLLLNPASTRTLSLTSAGKLGACTGLLINGAGTVVLVDNLVLPVVRILTLTQGNLKTDGASDNSGLIHTFMMESYNTNTRSLNLGLSTININNSSGFPWHVNSSGLTFSATDYKLVFLAGGTIDNIYPSSGTCNNTIEFQSSVNGYSLRVSGTIANAIFTGAASQTAAITLTSTALTVSTSLTLNGNSAINRLLVQSNTIGTARTITLGASATCASVSNYVDFQDITLSGGAANERDFQTNSKSAGDCGGNTGVTFTTAADQTWSGATGNWSNSALWTSRIPLPQDNVVIPDPGAASRTLTADMPRLGKDITVTNAVAANKPTLALTNQANTIYGSLTLVSSTYMTLSINKALTLAGRSNATLTSAGNTYGVALTVIKPGATLTANDATSCTTTSISANTTLDLSAYTWTITGSGAIWANLGTVTGGTSSIAVTYNGATATTFAGGTSTYNDIVITPGSGVLTFSGAFTFHDMKRSAAGTKTINFTKNTNYTMTGTDFFKPISGTDKFTLTGTGTGATDAERWTLTNNTTRVDTDYVDITECKAAGSTSPFYAGANSTTDNATNTGWTFTSPPSGSVPTTATYPGTMVDDNSVGVQAWTDPGNIAADDAAYAVSIIGMSYTETGYGAQLIIGGTPTGDWKTNTLDTTLRAGVYGGATDKWGLTPTVSQVNSSDFGIGYISTGMGGVSHRLKATNFGFTIPVGSSIDGIISTIERVVTGTGPYYNNVDYINLVIYYTEGGAPATQVARVIGDSILIGEESLLFGKGVLAV